MRRATRPSRQLRTRFRRQRSAAVAALIAATLTAAGCGAVERVTAKDGNAATGKTLFKTNCGSCHTLADAGTQGTIGPNLDAAFGTDKKQGFREQTIRDIVRGQIAYADQDTGTGQPGMPPNIVRGQQARDVAVYVARCAAEPKCDVSGTSSR
jgi:mono/diheme cytochrome c family protein